MLNILVVEDEKPIRDWIVYTISNISTDFNIVSSASNGKEAYELALKLNPQVIISDIKMPIMDGIELTKEIKKINPNIYIILLSNYPEFSYAQMAIRYGVYEYLIKSEIRPMELKEILIKIYETIKIYDAINKDNKIKEPKNNIVFNNNTKYHEVEINDKVYSKAINKAIRYIKENYKEQISLNDISKEVYLSAEYFSRLFKEEVGENFITYLTNYRMRKAEYLIKNTDMKISQISKEVGYLNASYFSKTYKRYKGVSPDDERI